METGPIGPAARDTVRWADISLWKDVLDEQGTDRPSALDAVATAVTARNVVVRRCALRLLEQISAPAAPVPDEDPGMHLLTSFLYDPVPLVMHEAYAAWRRLKGHQSVDPAEPYVTEGTWTWEASLGRLARMRGDVVGRRELSEQQPFRYHRIYSQVGGRYFERLQWPRGEVIDEVGTTALQASQWGEREGALWMIALLGDPAGVPCAREALADKVARVRGAALVALGSLGDDSIFADACTLVGEPGSMGPSGADALAFLGDARAYEAMWNAFALARHQESIVSCMGEFGELTADMPQRIASNPKVMARRSAVLLLRRLYGASALGPVMWVFDHCTKPRIRAKFLEPLQGAEGELLYLDLPREVLETLVRRAVDTTLELTARRQAWSHARQFVGPMGDRILEPYLRSLSPEDRKALTEGDVGPPLGRGSTADS